ncbi:MAG: segregation/condensation protein A [Nannocystis sp.]|nr:segregation/condensation protein A [Nannocystis sp.]MBA3547097.1 segregation/condensation protein A [Nannocystis sp.]
MEKGSESVAGDPRGRAAIYSVELEVFEGPLDLLLHLVRRHELDILDIPIAFVAEKYLEYLGMMRALDLEIAGDYLVMAATLAWLKSRELLPVQAKPGEEAGADDEEGEDPREALIRRLVEYERFKNAAAELDALPMSGRDVFARGADIEIPAMDPGLAPVTLFRLAEAYYRVLTRAKINKSHEVTIELVTVAQRMQQLTLMLDERQEFEFEGLFLGRNWSSEGELRTMLVVTLMSILELVKLGVARVQQVPDTDAIRIYRLVISEEARQQIEAYDEDQSFGAPVDLGPPQPSEAELDAAEQRVLLAEALSGVLIEDADLGPAATAAPAANRVGLVVVEDGSEEAGSHAQVVDVDVDVDDEQQELRLLAAELEALDAGPGDAVAEPEVALGEDEAQGAGEQTELDAELRLLAAELEALDEAEAEVAEPDPAETSGLEPAEVPDAPETSEPEGQGAGEETELDAELRLLAAELEALDAAEAVAEAVTFARGQVTPVDLDADDADDADDDAGARQDRDEDDEGGS